MSEKHCSHSYSEEINVQLKSCYLLGTIEMGFYVPPHIAIYPCTLHVRLIKRSHLLQTLLLKWMTDIKFLYASHARSRCIWRVQSKRSSHKINVYMNFLFLRVLHIVLKVTSRFECPNSNSMRSRNTDTTGPKISLYLSSKLFRDNLDTVICEKMYVMKNSENYEYLKRSRNSGVKKRPFTY